MKSKDAPDAGRRKALKSLAAGAGTAAVLPVFEPAQAALGSCGCGSREAAAPAADPTWKPLFFDSHQNETVIVLTDLIIPETETPGAKAAEVNRCIDLFLNEEEEDVRRQFLEGLAWIDGRALRLHGRPFIELAPEQQTALLEPLADPHNGNPEDQPGVRFFQDIKDWTIFGYYTSQTGLEQELQYGGDTFHDSFPGACNHPEHQS